jgi:hypothetical protein
VIVPARSAWPADQRRDRCVPLVTTDARLAKAVADLLDVPVILAA